MNQDNLSTSQLVDTEKFVLSAMLLKDGECVPTVMELLKSDDFSRPQHRIVFDAIAKIYLRGDIPNVLTLAKDLLASGELDKVGVELVYSLAQRAHTTSYVPQYCRDIKAAANNRKLVDIAAKIDEDAKQGTFNAADIIANATTAFSSITAENEQSQFIDFNDYLKSCFLKDLETEAEAADISTGFYNLDANISMKPGLYIIGAEPAMGKTTLVWQILDYLSTHDCFCVYCSYEMSKKAMFRKSVARAIFNENPDTVLTAANFSNNLKYAGHASTIIKAVEKVYNKDRELKVLELHGENIDSLIRKLTPLANTQKQLVICIDYVQIVKVDDKEGKQAVDEVLRRLSVFQRDTNSIIFAVSSFNRAGYRQPITYASFKESGALEYSAVALFGLQLAALNKLTGRESAIELDQTISDALRTQPRQVQLRCIKNRNGSSFDIFFNYYSAHDTFEPCESFEEIEGPPETKSNTNVANSDDEK